VIWLNGGPGCSSSAGLFFALGPCGIGEDGTNTTWNKYSWNTNTNMLFIDRKSPPLDLVEALWIKLSAEPAGVGYSYTDGPVIDSSFIAADDIWAFLQLFYKEFD
jgi:cathepsin A (carboxypeptidase C)